MTVWVADGIIHLRSNGTPSTSDSVIETLGVVRELTGGVARPVLFDARSWPAGDAGSWKTIIEAWESVFTAAAMLVDAEESPSVGKYLETIDRLLAPFEVFTDETAALTFLNNA